MSYIQLWISWMVYCCLNPVWGGGLNQSVFSWWTQYQFVFIVKYFINFHMDGSRSYLLGKYNLLKGSLFVSRSSICLHIQVASVFKVQQSQLAKIDVGYPEVIYKVYHVSVTNMDCWSSICQSATWTLWWIAIICQFPINTAVKALFYAS